MLVINPEECIDCGVCVPECPINAIIPDTEPGTEKWVEHNQKYANKWPQIVEKKAAPSDAKDWEKIPNKLQKHFDPNPAE